MLRGLMLMLALCLAVPAAAQTDEERAVLAPVEALFASFPTRDLDTARAQFVPEALVTSIRRTPDGKKAVVDASSLDDWLKGFAREPEIKLEEDLLSHEVRIDDDMATVWGRYIFRIDGKLSHCGVDSIQLVRRDGAWKLLSIAFTMRREGCEKTTP